MFWIVALVFVGRFCDFLNDCLFLHIDVKDGEFMYRKGS